MSYLTQWPAGDIDAMFDPLATDCVYFASDPNYAVYKAENLATVWLGLNCYETSPTKDKIVRQAIAMALNRDDIINACYENGACAYAPSSSFSRVIPGAIEVEGYSYDPEGAAKLLADNGYENLTIRMRCHARYKTQAEVVQAGLALAGITVNIEELATSGFTNRLKTEPEQYDMFISAFASTGGALNIIERYYLPNAIYGIVNYNNPDFVALYEEVAASTTLDGLLSGYGELQKMIAEDVPTVPIAAVYQWCIGTKNFGGVDLATQPIDMCVTNAFVIE